MYVWECSSCGAKVKTHGNKPPSCPDCGVINGWAFNTEVGE